MIRILILVCFAVLGVSCSNKTEFDLFMLAQEWPQSTCIGANISHQHTCRINANVTTWTIHGLWPTKKHENPPGPNYCDKTKKFKVSALYPIWPRLMKYWSNFYKETSVQALWQHEWQKHGTCAASVKCLDSELKYFNWTIGLNRKFDLYGKLQDAGIVPSDTQLYPYTTVAEALKGSTLMCYWDKYRKTQFLGQVEMCLSKTFKQIDCSSIKREDMNKNTVKLSDTLYFVPQQSVQYGPGSLENCRDTEDIAYPVIHHN